MESVASDWSSTTDSDSSLDKDDEDDVEEQETQSTIEPLSPEFRGRGASGRKSEDCEEENQRAGKNLSHRQIKVQ